MNVSAIIVTRGNVDLDLIYDSLPPEWEVLTWDNGKGECRVLSGWRPEPHPLGSLHKVRDLSVYGRYAAIEHAAHDLIYVQDDDVIVSDPSSIVETWVTATQDEIVEHRVPDPLEVVVCNMPQEFRHDFYTCHSLVGFGAAFHRDASELAFDRFWNRASDLEALTKEALRAGALFQRTCDIVFTALTSCLLVDVPKMNLPHAFGDDRMWRQPQHQAERARMLDLVMSIKEA